MVLLKSFKSELGNIYIKQSSCMLSRKKPVGRQISAAPTRFLRKITFLRTLISREAVNVYGY